MTAPSARAVRYPPGELLRLVHQLRGPLVGAGLGRHGFVYLLGAQANRFVFAESASFTWREAFDGLTPVDGETALIVSDGPDHRRRRALVQSALTPRAVADYIPIMATNADQMIDSWRRGQIVDVYEHMRAAIRRSTIESLFGTELADRADYLGAQLQPLIDLTDQLPQVIALRRRWRSPLWRRAMVARARVDELIYAEIARVRERPDGAHVLATLVRARDEDDQLSDLEIRDQVVSLIAAGYATTSGALGWAVLSMLAWPGVWDHARREVTELLGDAPPTAADLKALPYLDGVVRETLRLYPPAVISARKVARDLTFEGRPVRAGRMLIYSPYVTHRSSAIWSDADRFRPERWAGPDQPGQHEFVPFGGGPHRCVGATLATTEMAVVLSRLVARTTLTLEPQRVRAVGFASLRPRDGVLVRVG